MIYFNQEKALDVVRHRTVPCLIRNRMIDYSYDGINRLTQKKLTTDTPIYTNYDYKASDRGAKYTTSLIETEKLDKTTYKYYYDSVGNITKIDKGSAVYRNYTYDNKNQLVKEVNATTGITTNFTYDSLGNITKKVQSGAVSKTINYRYGNDGKSGWNNLLTGVDLDGNSSYSTTETITYDKIGNPTTYLGATLSWYGRQLKSYTKDSTSVSYTYDADGLRGTKTVNGTKSTYNYVDGQLRYEARGNLKFYYFYDAYGTISAIRYYPNSTSGYMYYPLVNSQGDVIALYDSKGTCVVTYEYDAWGNVVKTTDTSGRNIGELNPIRYRGYYYDSETGLYYVSSRYYDSKIGQFINADTTDILTATPMGVTDKNLFSYCDNNPVVRVDRGGQFWESAFDVISLGASIVEVAVNPYDPWAWVGLAGDLVDLVPFVTGVGETTRAIKMTVSIADGATDVVDAARKSYSALSKLDGACDFIKATGSYEVVFESGYKYVGKGGFYRSTTSALNHANKHIDKVISISWRSAPNRQWAFIDEYARQFVNKYDSGGVLYNKIWSPGRKIVDAIRNS